MARLFSKWLMSPSAEIIALSIGGICSTVLEESVLTIPDRLNQVLQFDYKSFDLRPIVLNLVKTAMCMDVLGRRIAAPVYLLSYFLVVWVAFFGRCPRLLLPWLVIGFFRHIVLNHISMLTSAFLGIRKALTWSLLQFVSVKVVEIVLYVYLWYSVLLLYRGLCLLDKLEQCATAVQAVPAVPDTSPCCRPEESARPRLDDGDDCDDDLRPWRSSQLLLLSPRRSRSVDGALAMLRDDWDDELELVGDYKQRAMHYLGLRPPREPPVPPLPPSRNIVCTEFVCDKAVQVNTISRKWLKKLQQRLLDETTRP